MDQHHLPGVDAVSGQGHGGLLPSRTSGLPWPTGPTICAAYAQLSGSEPDAALRSATEAVRTGERIGEEWLIATGETMLGAAQVALGQDAEGRETLRDSIHRARACGQFWTAAFTEILLARAMLAAGEPTEDVLDALHRALAGLRNEDDVSSMLTALHTGVLALAGTYRDRATRLRAAVDRLAARYGIRPGEINPAIEDQLKELLGPALPAGPDREKVDWAEAIALLTASET